MDEARPGRGETVADFARENPGLVVAGGIALGLLAGALLPRAARSRLGQRTMAAASAAGGALGESAGAAGRRAARAAESTGSKGLELARTALDVVSALRRR